MLIICKYIVEFFVKEGFLIKLVKIDCVVGISFCSWYNNVYL